MDEELFRSITNMIHYKGFYWILLAEGFRLVKFEVPEGDLRA